jgi:uncharacterized repeat protein (TIGR03803 family)
LQSLTGATDGGNSQAELVQGSDGSFYGTTEYDSAVSGGYGTVFQISTNGVLNSLYSFTPVNDGDIPNAGLVQGSDGNFYGTTLYGGTNGSGTVFKITPNGVLTSLYSFTCGNDSGNPLAGLVQGSDGNFYGTTPGCSYFSPVKGTVFKISSNGALTTLYSFTGGYEGRGVGPSRLVQGSDGYFYGTTYAGGTNNVLPGGCGTVFKISSNGALTSLYSFGSVLDANGVPLDGANPVAGLVQGSDGNFYGTTGSTVFQMTPAGELTTLASFGSPSALVQGSDGYFYGTTSSTVFKISTNGALTTLCGLGGQVGEYPGAGLVQGSDGNLYGTTDDGGPGGAGTVFRLTIVPEFQAVTLTNRTLSLTWSTEAGGTYQLQWSADLSSSNWTNLRGPVTAAGATLITTDSVTNAPQRFYRLVLLPEGPDPHTRGLRHARCRRAHQRRPALTGSERHNFPDSGLARMTQAASALRTTRSSPAPKAQTTSSAPWQVPRQPIVDIWRRSRRALRFIGH